MLIVLMGLDGSGKTTQAKKIVSYFQIKGKRVSYIHWLRFYPSKKNWHQSKKPKLNGSTRTGLFYITVRTVFCIFNAFLVSVKVVFNLLIGKTVILDRYLIDEFVQLRYKGLNKRIFLFFLKIIPVNKNMFYFQIDPYKAFQREGSHDLSYFEKKVDYYKQAIKIKRIKTIKVDGEEETFHRLLKEVL